MSRLSLLVQIITPFNIYFNARLIFQKYELWRLLTNFCYFGNLSALAIVAAAGPVIVFLAPAPRFTWHAPAGLDFVFHMFFLIKYSSSLEEGSFRSSSADFLWMLMFGAPFAWTGQLHDDP